MPDFRPLIPILGLCLGLAHALPKYTFAILDTGRNLQVRGMNDSGVVIGDYQTDTSDSFRAFMIKDGVFRELGDFGGGQSSADAINNHGVIVGTAKNILKEMRPYYRESDTLFEIMPYPGEYRLCINDKGQIAGMAGGYGSVAGHGYLFDHGLVKILPAQFRPTAINDSGVIVGQGESGAAVYQGDTLIPLPVPPGFTSVNAVDINNRGQIAGYASRGDSSASFLFENGVFTWLPATGATSTRAVSLNDRGQVVGTRGLQNKASYFLYDNGNLYDLLELAGPSFGGVLMDVSCINNLGQIATLAKKGPLYSDWVSVILTPSATARLVSVARRTAPAATGPGYRLDGKRVGREAGRPPVGLRLQRNGP